MILANTSDGRKTFVLAHDSYCTALGRCVCGKTPWGRLRAAHLSLGEGEHRSVPRAALSVPEIARAIARGRLRAEGVRR